MVGMFDPRRLRIFVLANTIGLTLCVLLSMLFPQPAGSAIRYPGYTSDPVSQFNAVRDGTLRVLDLGHITGIITFPSYHTLLAILVGYAFVGLPRLFPWIAAFQFAIIITTRGVGGHYFADMIAGAALAVLAIWSARQVVMFLERRSHRLVWMPLRSTQS